LDPYVFTRESFLQWRNNLATDGKAEATDVDGLDDEAPEGDKGAASGHGSSDDAGNKAGFALSMDADTKDLVQARYSFSSVAQSFDNTAKSFEDAGAKVDKLKKSKSRR